jgi:hypothetical protein
VFRPDEVPVRVLHDSAIETTREVEYAFRKGGQGNHRWFLKLRSGSTMSVSYGGRGKSEPTRSSA